MLNLIKLEETNDVTIDQLMDILFNQSQKYVIFYYTQSSDSYPAFLMRKNKGVNHRTSFMCPLYSYTNETYNGENIRESLEKALKAGKKIKILPRNEMHKLFNRI